MAPGKRSRAKPRDRPRGGPTRTHTTLHLPESLINEVRDAVVHLSGPPERMTLARFAEDAFQAELARLKDKHTGGKRFPRRRGELRPGRPIGS
jgi:hypothetical protein